MAKETIEVDRAALRGFDQRTEEADAAIVGACDAVEAALATLRAGADGIDVPGPAVLDSVRLHHDRARALGEVFDLVVDRFDRSQLDRSLPLVFAPFARDFVGPRSREVANTEANRRWLNAELERIRLGGPSGRAQQTRDELRRTVGLRSPSRVRVARREFSWSASGSTTFGAEVGTVWVVEEFSDGSADVTLHQLHESVMEYGLGGTVELDCLGAGVGGGATAAASLALQRGRSSTRSFPSGAAAAAFVRDHRLRAAADRLLGALPLVGVAANWFDGGGMEGAPVQELSRGAAVAVGGGVRVRPPGENPVAAEGSASGQLTRAERVDERTGVSTEVTVLHGAVGATATALGQDWTPGLAFERRVAVTRDDEGRPVSLTVTRTWDGAGGQRPPGTAPTAERRPADPEAADSVHHYELEVAVDLADARNAPVLERIDAGGPAGPLGAFEVAQLAALVDEEAVRARSPVTFLDQVTTASEVCKVEMDGAAGVKVEVGTAVATNDRRTVAAWTGTGEHLVQVVGG